MKYRPSNEVYYCVRILCVTAPAARCLKSGWDDVRQRRQYLHEARDSMQYNLLKGLRNLVQIMRIVQAYPNPSSTTHVP